MSKTQNTKNEQQKDLCSTSEQLTEQWVNIYKSKKCGSYWSGAFCYKTKEEAFKDLADKENYLTTVNIEDMLNLQTQNAQLKEQIECLEKQLKIAVKALNLYKQENWSYEDEYINYPCKTGGWIHAEKALQQIKELNK